MSKNINSMTKAELLSVIAMKDAQIAKLNLVVNKRSAKSTLPRVNLSNPERVVKVSCIGSCKETASVVVTQAAGWRCSKHVAK